MNIWISGANGRVAQALKMYLNPIDFNIYWTDKDSVDITNSLEVRRFANTIRPEAIINCSGYTDPIACEENPDMAFAVNAIGARNLAVQAERFNGKLIELSADDVFNGKLGRAYTEFDEPTPFTVYGKSKLAGEEYIKSLCSHYFIIRTSWLYSPVNKRVENIIKWAENGETIYVTDQYSSPTSVYELAQFIIHILNTHAYGTYHATCIGQASRKELVEKVLELKGLTAEIETVGEFEDSKLRPDFSVLKNYVMHISNVYQMSSWETALKNYMEKEGLI